MATKKIRLAIVDDHQLVIDGLLSLLSGYTNLEILHTSNEPRKMLEMIKADPPDILLTDVMMPGMNGEELAREVTNQELVDVKVLGEKLFREPNGSYTYWVAIEANKQTTDNQDKAAQRVPIDLGKGVRQLIVLACLFAVVAAPFVLPFFGISTFAEFTQKQPESFFGLIPETTRKYFAYIRRGLLPGNSSLRFLFP